MCPLVWAETLTITAEGEYVVGGGESMDIGEDRAQKKAEQNAAEEAGAFVKSYTKVRNLALDEDLIEVVANHAMKVIVLEKKKSALGNLDAIKCLVKIKAVMTTEEVEANLKKVQEDNGVIDSYNRLKADYDRQAGEMESLKKRLTESSGEEKKQVLVEITNEEKRFKANLWLEKATEQRYRSAEMGQKAYDKAIELNPDLVEAYIGRAEFVAGMGVGGGATLLNKEPPEGSGKLENLNKALANLNKALSDLNKAISLDKGRAEAYVARADVYNGIRDVQCRIDGLRQEGAKAFDEINKKYASQIFESLDSAISLKSDNPKYYSQRSHYYLALRADYDNAGSDMSRAIVLCRETDCNDLPFYYEARADIYMQAGKMELYEKDYAEATRLYAKDRKLHAGKDKENGDLEVALQKSELAKLRKELYAGSITEMDEKEAERTLKALDLKISQNKGKAEDYILRADLGRGRENKLRDYSEAIRLLKPGMPVGGNALLLTRVYLYKAMAYEKQNDLVLKELKEAQHVLDQNLPRAMDLMKADNYQAILTGPDQEVLSKLMTMTRSEAEAFSWMDFADKIANSRAAIYEEMGLPVKAKSEYQYLCEKLKDAHACKNLERLK
jgi:tetratricopeptide (TPR) repeat protein